MSKSIFELSFRLLINGTRFRYLKWTGRPARPQALSLEITHHCLARCVMCNIWKIPKEVPDLALEDWVDLISSELFSELRELDITGGEPFLRNDLSRFFIALSGLKRKNLTSLKSIALTTNGLLTDRILEEIPRITSTLKEEGLDLVVVCALDAAGPLHDRIRNFPGAWDRVRATVAGLIKIREAYPNLIVGLKTTIIPVNVGELEKICRYAEANGLFTIISPCIITEGRYLNPEKASEMVFSPQDREEMIRFFQGQRFHWAYHNRKLLDWFQRGIMIKPCSCGFNYFFVRYNGEVFLCPLIDRSIGNIKEASISDLFSSRTASQVREKIGRYPECRRCTEPGLERYALPFEGFTYWALLFKMGKEKFLQMHRHLGMDKYFD